MFRFIYNWFFGKLPSPKKIDRTLHERYDPVLDKAISKAILMLISPNCIQPHEFDAFFQGSWIPYESTVVHIRNCRGGFLARGGKKALDKVLASHDS